MPSKLHIMLKAHEGMTLTEKERCNCKLCKNTSVDKNYKAEIKVPNVITKSSNVITDIDTKANKFP